MTNSKPAVSFLIWIFLLLILGCHHNPPLSPGNEQQAGGIRINLNKESMPAQVNSVTITLKRVDFESIIRDFFVADSGITVRIDSLAIGTWQLQVDAKNSEGRVLFSGTTTVLIEPGRVTSVILQLHEATGSLEITITWPGTKLVIFHGFDDGWVPAWGGNALAENVGGVLKITSTEAISWRWEIFDHGAPGIYSKGVFEFDAKFGTEGHFFDLRGHSASIHDINWGPKVDFTEGKVLVDEVGFVDTGTRFEPGDWYHVRAVFDNSLGERGRYALHLQNLTREQPEVLVGEFNYYASNGRLEDIVQYSFGVRTLDRVAATSLHIDNVRLQVE
jgi:hypothetical protein